MSIIAQFCLQCKFNALEVLKPTKTALLLEFQLFAPARVGLCRDAVSHNAF